MTYQELFQKLDDELKDLTQGQQATYIPELAKVNPDQFGVCLIGIDCSVEEHGDSQVKFSIQSIVKVLSLVLAFKKLDDDLWKRVGVEPSGSAFNSLIQLEYEKGIPRNPFINAGAIVIADVLLGILESPEEDFLEFVRELSGRNSYIDYNHSIAKSEKAYGFRNAALINMMKSYGNIEHDVNDVLDFYFKICSIKMTCEELSKTFLFLANHGVNPITKQEVLSSSKTKRINAIMQLCGFYNEAGEFAFKVGLPAKSGVGGGIIAILPDQYSMSVWSPKLNEKGNSLKGFTFLERFTTETSVSIF